MINDIIFPKEVSEFLKKLMDLDPEMLISEIEFGTSRIDKNTGKRVFKVICYKVEDSEDDLEIYINNDEFLIELGDFSEKGNFTIPYDFDENTIEVSINKLNDIII